LLFVGNLNKLYFHDYKFMFIPPPNACLEDVLIHKNIISETIKKKKNISLIHYI